LVAPVIDVLIEAAHETWGLLRKRGVRGLGARGCLILVGFVLMLAYTAVLVVALLA
jgi:hypothetical protein